MTTARPNLGDAATRWLERATATDEPSGAPRAADWPLLPVLALWLAAWAVLGWPWLSGRVTVPWDAKAHFLPQIQFLAQSIAAGDWPFWTPYVFSGHPQIADPQSMIFSPPFLLLAMIDGNPSLRAVDATVLAMILAGGAALILFFRDRGWHWAGGLVAAIAFGFGASMAWRIQHVGQVLSLVYLAIAWLLLTRALERGSIVRGALAGIVAGFMVLGRDQVALLGVYLLIGVVARHWLAAEDAREAMRRSIRPLLAGGIGGALIVVLPVLLTLLVAAESNRPEIDYIGAGRGSLHPALLLTLLAPDVFGASGRMEDYWGPPSFTWNDTGLYIAQNMGQIYIGAAPALLLLAGLVMGTLWARNIRFVTIALLATTVYALGWYTPVFRALHALLPGVALYRRPADATFLIGLLAAILAGYAAHRLSSERWPRPSARQCAMLAVLVGGAFAYALYLAIHFDRLDRAALPLAVAAASVAAGALAICAPLVLAPRRRVLAALVLVAVSVLDLAWANGPSTSSALPTRHYEVLQPDSDNETSALLKRLVTEGRSATRRDRIELAGLGFHWPNASLTHGLENTLGYNPVRLGLYSRATGAQDTVGLPDQRKFSPLMPSYRSRLANMLGLRYIATGVPIEQIDKSLQPGDMPLVARTREGYVYENVQALPRVQFATRAALEHLEDLTLTGQWPAIDPSTTVLLELLEARREPDPKPRGAGTAAITSYRNTEIEITADSPDGGWVVLYDVWHPWWTAEIDGTPARLLKANVLFRAVEVPPGRHVVRFNFRPIRGALRDLLSRLTPDFLKAIPTSAQAR